MRKVLSTFLVASVLLLCAAPIFCMAATAPFTFYTSQSAPVADSSHWYFVIASDDSDGILVVVENQDLGLYTSGYGVVFNSNIPSVSFRMSIPSDYHSGTQISMSYYDLTNGYLLSTETGTTTLQYNQGFVILNWYPSRIFGIDNYITSPYYSYAIGSSIADFSYVAGYNEVDPFVAWNTSPPSPDPPTPPIDPNEVIRSLIPRPFGNASTMYIADHLYLYAIYMGVPQQFEEQGLIQTSLDPAEYDGDNYNIYDVTFSASGSTLTFVIKNRAQFSYNCIISKYDVIDGSYISSDIRAITVASSADQPSTNTMTISLSDPALYGIYQSGFFARSNTISYPELRISWSDTIDYSLDFFVIRQGIVTIVEGINTTNSSLTTANSTLSTISTTSSSILAEIEAFYTLAEDNWYWFKNTFYIVMSNKWNITNQYLLAIHKLLIETDETMTIEDDTSGVASMESAKNDLVITNASGQPVDAADAAAAGLSEAASQIGEIAQPVSTINQLMQTIVFDKPKLLLPVIVALGLGLMVTILGKNKSD